jgi:peptidoglycan hydrolase CwlO-like protein
MTENKEIVVLKGQISKLENQANEITITTPEENASAIELKAKLKDIGKQIKERKEAITKPLNVALKSARELFRLLRHVQKWQYCPKAFISVD